MVLYVQYAFVYAIYVYVYVYVYAIPNQTFN